MEYALNNAPELTMSEITKNLFNNQFLSDIEFNIEGKVIFAHGLELMKRSIAFENELKSKVNETRTFAIEQFTYNSFYEFIRFIYTDVCDVNIDNGIELYKLAKRYKVVKLENQVTDCLLQGSKKVPLTTRLALYEFCIMENYELPYDLIKNDIARNLSDVMDLVEFTTIQPNVMEDLLKLDCVDENVKEIQIFEGLMHWMNSYCFCNDISLAQRREKFNALLRLIRYSNMNMEEFRQCMVKYSDIFEDNDMFKYLKDPTSIARPRNNCQRKYERKNVRGCCITDITKFTVSKEVLFTGFKYGTAGNQEIKIYAKELETATTAFIRLDKKFKDSSIFKTVSLGETLVMKPKTEYTVQVIYDNGGCTCWCLTYRLNEIVIHDSSNVVQILIPGSNMFEMFFQPKANEAIAEPPMAEPTASASKEDLFIFESSVAETESELLTNEVPLNISSKQQPHRKSSSISVVDIWLPRSTEISFSLPQTPVACTNNNTQDLKIPSANTMIKAPAVVEQRTQISMIEESCLAQTPVASSNNNAPDLKILSANTMIEAPVVEQRAQISMKGESCLAQTPVASSKDNSTNLKIPSANTMIKAPVVEQRTQISMKEESCLSQTPVASSKNNATNIKGPPAKIMIKAPPKAPVVESQIVEPPPAEKTDTLKIVYDYSSSEESLE